MGVDIHSLLYFAAESLRMAVVGHYSELDALPLSLFTLGSSSLHSCQGVCRMREILKDCYSIWRSEEMYKQTILFLKMFFTCASFTVKMPVKSSAWVDAIGRNEVLFFSPSRNPFFLRV